MDSYNDMQVILELALYDAPAGVYAVYTTNTYTEMPRYLFAAVEENGEVWQLGAAIYDAYNEDYEGRLDTVPICFENGEDLRRICRTNPHYSGRFRNIVVM